MLGDKVGQVPVFIFDICLINKLRMKHLNLFLLVFLAASCSNKKKNNIVDNQIEASSVVSKPSREFITSLVKLIANPEVYNGKTVQIIGYLNLEFEGNAVYLHREDYENGLTGNGFWVGFSGPIKEGRKLDCSK